jgi:hypothetical protein
VCAQGRPGRDTGATGHAHRDVGRRRDAVAGKEAPTLGERWSSESSLMGIRSGPTSMRLLDMEWAEVMVALGGRAKVVVALGWRLTGAVDDI